MKTEPNYNIKYLTPTVIDLIKRLIKKDVNKRLPFTEIPNHPWFAGIDFDKIEANKVKAPFVPETKNETDISNIDPIFLNEEIVSPYKTFKPTFDDNIFSDF